MNDKLNNQLSNLFITMPRQFGRTKFLQLALYYEMCYTYSKELVDIILEEQDCSIDDVEKYINKVDEEHIYYYDMRHFRPNIYDGASISFRSLYNIIEDFADECVVQAQPSIDQITSIKSQLKHCKNPLQKLNLEREMNRLIIERRMNK